jgi:hypothetical protein
MKQLVYAKLQIVVTVACGQPWSPNEKMSDVSSSAQKDALEVLKNAIGDNRGITIDSVKAVVVSVVEEP